MTMPKTAAFMKSLPQGTLPEEMSYTELSTALHALRSDLPGNPLDYIEWAAPKSKICDCGAIHLNVNAGDLDAATASSLHRLLATPYGDLVREHHRRKDGYQNVRFGWEGLETQVPRFVTAVDSHDACTSIATDIDDNALRDIINAFRDDMPNVMQMLERSASSVTVHSVSPSPSDENNQAWKHLIDQVMFAWSTPVRKYLVQWLSREHGLYGGAVNCCIIMTARSSSETQWRRRWTDEQTSQQLTPDC